MTFDFMTPEIWNGLIVGVILIGLSLALLRLYRDLSRPIKRERTNETNSFDHSDKP